MVSQVFCSIPVVVVYSLLNKRIGIDVKVSFLDAILLKDGSIFVIESMFLGHGRVAKAVWFKTEPWTDDHYLRCVCVWRRALTSKSMLAINCLASMAHTELSR